MDIEARPEVSPAPATPQSYVPPLPPPSQLGQEQAQVPPPPAETPDTAAVAGITQEGVDTTSSAVVATTVTATDKFAQPPQEGSSIAPASATPADDSRTDGGGGGGGGEDSKDGGESREGGGKEGSSRPKRPREKDLPVGLPKSMVRRIMKLGEDTRNVSNEALVVVVKASELFLEKFAARAFGHAEKLGRRTIKYQDVSDVRVNDANLLFLEAVVPP